MNDPSYPYKLRIARIAYREISDIIDKYEGRQNLIDIACHWNRKITVDGTEFYEFELRERE